VFLQEQQVLNFDRVLAADPADHARHRVRMPGTVERAARVVDVHAFQRGGEAVGIALPADFAVGDDVEPGLLLRADGEQRGIVLRLGEEGFRNAP
jgi:hypothetical protein